MPIYIADVLIVRDGKILMVQQGKPGAKDLWSFPGGHVEDDESPREAAIREAHEEIGVAVENVNEFEIYRFTENGRDFELHSHTADFSGDIMLEEGLLAYKWFTLDEILADPSNMRGTVTVTQSKAVLS